MSLVLLFMFIFGSIIGTVLLVWLVKSALENPDEYIVDRAWYGDFHPYMNSIEKEGEKK